jgi:deoxyribonuclease V
VSAAEITPAWGLALHLGAQLDMPTVGITHRTLLAEGDWPGDRRHLARPAVALYGE